jgi:hypothetical protein
MSRSTRISIDFGSIGSEIVGWDGWATLMYPSPALTTFQTVLGCRPIESVFGKGSVAIELIRKGIDVGPGREVSQHPRRWDTAIP